MQRDVIKTMSFAVMHFSVAFAIAYALTGSVAVATGIGLIEPFANSVAFYFHERVWRRIESRPAISSRTISSQENVPILCHH